MRLSMFLLRHSTKFLCMHRQLTRLATLSGHVNRDMVSPTIPPQTTLCSNLSPRLLQPPSVPNHQTLPSTFAYEIYSLINFFSASKNTQYGYSFRPRSPFLSIL